MTSKSQDLKGRSAVITGAAAGIGAATAQKLAEQGASVVIGDVAPGAEETAQRLAASGLQVKAVRADVTNEDSVSALMDAAIDFGDGLDIVVANAGIAEPKAPIHELDVDHWRKVLDIDLTGTAITFKYGAEAMKRASGDQHNGAMVAVSSILGLVGQSQSSSYSAAKAGVANLVRSVGLTYAPEGIRVNAIAPGYVDTALVAGLDESVRESMISKMPNGRLGRPEEIAEVVAFLASDKASFVNAAIWSVDGGYVAQ